MYRIELDELPPKLNSFYSGMHWVKRKQLVDYWHKQFFFSFKKAKLPKPLKWPVNISIILFSRLTPRDCDSTVMGVKLAQDALVNHGYLPDDTPQYIQTVILQSKKSADKRDKMVLVIQPSSLDSLN